MTLPGTDDIPEGKLDMLMSIDFRMTSTTLLSDIVLPAATWYEKADLSSTDMHPVCARVQPGHRPAVGNPVRLRGFRRDRRAFSTLAASIWAHARRRARHAPARHPRRDGVSGWHRT